jgi:AmmeMemoRadiSam system protein B
MSASTRRPAVAGTFYPDDPGVLAKLVDGLLDSVSLASEESLARAYVVPHAGLRYSGPTAAVSYARLRAAGSVSRAVLVGPAHYVAVRGCAVPTVGRWATPLGEVEIDIDGCTALADAGLATADDAPHEPEHSLEVQVPFLQRTLGESVRLLPIVVGPSTVDHVATVIAAALPDGPAGTVLLCSTDLSHYLDDASAREQDRRTLAAVERLDAGAIGTQDACGVYALRGLLGWASREELGARLLDYSTSADTGSDPGRVVGYSAVALS